MFLKILVFTHTYSHGKLWKRVNIYPQIFSIKMVNEGIFPLHLLGLKFWITYISLPSLGLSFSKTYIPLHG